MKQENIICSLNPGKFGESAVHIIELLEGSSYEA